MAAVLNIPADDLMLDVRNLYVGFGARNVIDGLSFGLRKGEILGLIGPSGSGKSVSLRAILGLLPIRSGSVDMIAPWPLAAHSPNPQALIRSRSGVLFQQGALFSSLTVLENIEFPMRESLKLSDRLMTEVARLKIDLVGLPPDAADRYPSQLSGGMIKRAALARALALDPEILFLDEPTAGLDPIGAAKFDELILTLRDTLGLTVLMVTHDLDSLAKACDRIVALSGGKLLMAGTLADMRQSDDPWLREYFHGPRARNLGE